MMHERRSLKRLILSRPGANGPAGTGGAATVGSLQTAARLVDHPKDLTGPATTAVRRV